MDSTSLDLEDPAAPSPPERYPVRRPGRPRRRVLGIGRVLAWRAAFAVPILLLVTAVLFVLGKASPFDPVTQYLGDAALTTRGENLDQIRRNWGLDDPLPTQYLRWLGNLVRGDLGPSHSTSRPVAQVLAERAGWSALLAGAALVVLLVASLAVGTLAAWRRGRLSDRIVTACAYAVAAAPVFWLALGALWLFSIQLGWLPSGGTSDATSIHPGIGELARHLILPVGVLAVSQSSWFVLFVREAVIGVLREDFVLAARARGLRERTVLIRHALRSALLPYLTLVGTHVPELVTGAILVETIFGWPGLGRASVEAAFAVDFPLLAALTLLAAVAVLAGNLFADLAYAVADPRVSLDG